VTGEGDQPGVVVAADTAEEAGRVATTLRAGGFHPTIDYGAIADRLGKFPVLVPAAELGEAKGFLRGLRASQQMAPAVAAAASAPIPGPGFAARPSGHRSPVTGRALAQLTGLAVVVAGGVMALASMLQFFSSLRDH
jgi:hypothetical protein